MDERKMLTELGIDPDLSAGEIKKALEKKKQGLLRKLNAVFGNAAKEQELNKQLEQVEELIIQLGLRQVMEVADARDDRSALLSNVQGAGTVRLRDFRVETRELSQTKADVASGSPPIYDDVYQQALNKALACMDARDMDGAYEAIFDFDPEEYPVLYAVLGSVYGTQDCTYYNVEKHFQAFLRGSELDVVACYIPLANAYRYGWGTDVNLNKAIQWLQKASEEDSDAKPEQMLGEIYGQQGQYKEMFIWYQLGLYEHDSWQCRIDLAQAILKYKLTAYTQKALEMLQDEVRLGGETKDCQRRLTAYRGLMNYYSDLANRDTRYRKQVLQITETLAEEKLVSCAAIVASMYQSGYSGKPDYAKAVAFYEQALANGEQFDRAQYEQTKRSLRREEKSRHIEDRVFTKADAEELVKKTRRERSDVLRIPEGYTKIDGGAFEAFRGTGLFKKAFFSEVVLPNSLLGVGAWAFYDLKGLKRYNLPPNLVKMDMWSFYVAESYFEQLTIPGDVQTIPYECFKGNQSGTVRVEEGVEVLEEGAFAFASIRHLELPSTLKKIKTGDECAFRGAKIGSLRAPRALKEQIELQKQLQLDAKNITYYGE